ncbi:MAG TPA: hypothetical protein VEA69_15500 [Tepidisphaeraceae bacterium]|nr:hypothetical protein [Tepidisphaeraceae bacterium]
MPADRFYPRRPAASPGGPTGYASRSGRGRWGGSDERAILSDYELHDFRAPPVSLEGTFVPDDEPSRGVPQGRVAEAHSTSSMGTADAGWRTVGPGEAVVREPVVVYPPGDRAYETPSEARADDRDVEGCCGGRSTRPRQKRSGGRRRSRSGARSSRN